MRGGAIAVDVGLIEHVGEGVFMLLAPVDLVVAQLARELVYHHPQRLDLFLLLLQLVQARLRCGQETLSEGGLHHQRLVRGLL